MAEDHKTLTLWELPEISEISDNDIFTVANGNTTHRISGKSLIQYLKNHEYITDYFVHQDTVGSANGVAALDGNKKILSENIPFGSHVGSVYEGASGKALETTVETKADRTELNTHAANRTAHITNDERILWNTVTEKVAKVNGKSLSSNDFTNADKSKLQGIENGANHYIHPNSDGSKHIPANGTDNSGKYLKAAATAGIYEWSSLTREDVTTALGYTPSGSDSVTYRLGKSGSTIVLTGSDGSKTSVSDADTTYTISDFGIVAAPAEINQVKGASSNLQAQLDNTYTKKEADALLNDKLSKTGDAGNTTVTYMDAEALTALSSGEKQSIAYGKLKQAVDSVISHTRLLGTTDISSIGGGTVTDALSALQNNMTANKLNIPATYTAFTITDIISDAIITLKTDEDHVAGFYCRFKAVQPLAANVNYRIASFYGGLPDQANMVVPIVILTPATVPCGTGMLIFGAGVLYMISNIDIPSGYIIQGSASYVM